MDKIKFSSLDFTDNLEKPEALVVVDKEKKNPLGNWKSFTTGKSTKRGGEQNLVISY